MSNLLRMSDIMPLKNIRNTADIDEMAASLLEVGQLSPISVYPHDGKYAIRFGHRRYLAAQKLGWTEIRAEICETPDEYSQVLMAQYEENMQRQTMTFMDKANVAADLVTTGKLQVEVAEMLKVSEATVSVWMSALDAAPAVQKALNAGKLSAGAAKTIFALDHDAQEELLPQLVGNSVRNAVLVTNAYKMSKLSDKKFDMTNDSDNEDDSIFDEDTLMEEAVLAKLDEAIDALKGFSDEVIRVRTNAGEAAEKVAFLRLLLSNVSAGLSR